MSWMDRMRHGSWRGARFWVDSHDATHGRRIAQHEYPQRDEPWSEDLGRAARGYSLDLYVLGPDYDIERDALRRALDLPGPGTLIHPYLGTMRVVAGECRLRESSREGGMARFSVTFHEAGKAVQASHADTAAQLRAAAAKAQSSTAESFAAAFSLESQPAHVHEQARQDLASGLEALRSALVAVQGVSVPSSELTMILATLDELILTPPILAQRLTDLFDSLGAGLDRPATALGVFGGLFGHGEDAAPLPGATPAIIRAEHSREALFGLIRQAAATACAGSAADWEFDNSADALDALEQLDMALDDAGADAAPSTHLALSELRSRLVRDIRQRSARLPILATWESPAVQPALVLAQRIYGDASRAEEVATRNHVAHPLFVPAGALEILEAADV